VGHGRVPRNRALRLGRGAQPGRAAVIELARELVLVARRIDLDDEEILGLERTAANGA
jgi:hypothetical protein